MCCYRLHVSYIHARRANNAALKMGSKNKNVVFAVINNIPETYHSCDLRNFFSEQIETDGFECFHFKHRPEVQILSESIRANVVDQTQSESLNENCLCPSNTNTNGVPKTAKKSFCCIVKLTNFGVAHLRKKYHRKHWIDRQGESLPELCSITRISVHTKINEGKLTCCL